MEGDKWHLADKHLYQDPVYQDTDDWEVASMGGLVGGAGGGGGCLYFWFRSLQQQQYVKMAFVCGGVSAGMVGGIPLDDGVDYSYCSEIPWQSMRESIVRPFSTMNLTTDCIGRVSVASLATPGKVGWGYTRFVITAQYLGEKTQGFLFDKFEWGGTGTGTGGLGLGCYVGKWVFYALGDKTDSNWTKPVCAS